MQNWVLTELDSGERIVSERLEHVRSAAVGYWIGAGSRDERAEEAGVSHFIEHMLFKGTGRYSAIEIAEIFDGLGGELNAATSREHTLVYSRVPDHHLETAMDVMSDMVFAPAFADLDSEREVVHELLWRVVVHRDLLEHHLPLGVELGERRREDHVAHHVHCGLEVMVRDA